ncbi:MAG: methyltransferase domain-containing protein [Terracidiphilus sp.]|jgi:ubiquinone/menaquinone biosynthesis C-methylase UbiE
MTASVNQSIAQITPLAEPFDSIAPDYDRLFTTSAIGKAQRAQVSREIERCFSPLSHVLELNCGTGEDALALAHRGVSVSAYDASPEMVRMASQRLQRSSLSSNVQFAVLRNEHLSRLEGTFDGAFSNFAGLNCSQDWMSIADELARLVKPGGHVLLCILGRTCLWEVIHYLLRGRFHKAFRRVRRGPTLVRINESSMQVIYPSVGEAKKLFSSGFTLYKWRGVGVFVPPSHCEPHVQGRNKALDVLKFLDLSFAHLPGVRCWGDHILLDFVRRAA